MSRALSLTGAATLLLAVALALVFFVRELGSGVLSIHPEVLAALEVSLESQKRLAGFDPDHSSQYRAHFEDVQVLMQRLRIVESNRAALRSRYETIVLVLMMLAVLSAVSVFALQQRRQSKRLERIRCALEDLAESKPNVTLSFQGFDVISRIAGMIEHTSRIMTADRKRLATLRNLSAWQEAARRHAHEMRTPLTGARLEISRLIELARRRGSKGQGEGGENLEEVGRSAMREIDRLSAFSREFTSFAQLRSPNLEIQDLGSFVADFCRAFKGAWDNLELVNDVEACTVRLDRGMIRQVLANLCENSAHASPSADAGGLSTVLFSLQSAKEGEGSSPTLLITDQGTGINPSIRSTLFEPYTTTKSIGSGMGLGLAICKKVMLDHGGDLELGSTGSGGTTFHLIFQAATETEVLTAEDAALSEELR